MDVSIGGAIYGMLGADTADRSRCLSVSNARREINLLDLKRR